MTARIMIVEDERIVALDLKTALEYIGFKVVKIVSRGLDAVQFAEQLSPDLILMDINLQDEVDGIEAALRIRENYRIPVVFLTAYAEEKTLKRAELCFPYGYLLKPFELRELEATIRMALARRQAEIQVEQAEERLQLAVDAASLGVWEWETHSNEFKAMGHFEKILGVQPKLIKESIQHFLSHFEEADREWIAAALERGEQVNSTLKMTLENATLWIDLHAKSYQTPEKGGTKVIGVIRDVTSRRLREEQLRQANVVYNAMAEGILILDASRKIISCNPAFTKITGFTPERVSGRDPDDFLHVRRHSDGFYSLLSAEANRNWQGEIACMTASKTVFPAWQQVCCVHESDGAISNYVIIVSDISALRRAEAHINHLAFHDALTGLGNRHLLESRLGLEIERANQSGSQLALYLLDLDGFKFINDALGHQAGDELLKAVATRIQSHLRSSDIAIRLGGDEFVIIVPDVSSDTACVGLAEKLLADVRGDVGLAVETITISASIGIALYPRDANDSASLIRAADRAMYCAKERGKNKFCFYLADMALNTNERVTLQQELMHAAERKEFDVFYQPIWDTHSTKIIAFEALLRWTNPTRGTMLPAEFLALMVESGVEKRILEWFFNHIVADAACLNQLRTISEYGRRMLVENFKICINLSPGQLREKSFLHVFDRVFAVSSLKRSQLEIELTESVIQQMQASKAILDELAGRGVSFALDNFGTGYSSIASLKNLPIGRIKIDRSFIKSVFSETASADIVVAIAALAKSLGMKLTAEGVETIEQLEFARRLGCDAAQGFLYAPAMCLDDIVEFLESNPERLPNADPVLSG
ncbi:MAG TPA: EAL domain-containing protein [Pseudomonadales bacterium]|nr:EAL domain-containing protein [Pseudomonadales bacterium]